MLAKCPVGRGNADGFGTSFDRLRTSGNRAISLQPDAERWFVRCPQQADLTLPLILSLSKDVESEP